MVQRKRKLKRSVVNFLVVILIIAFMIFKMWIHRVEHLRLDF